MDQHSSIKNLYDKKVYKNEGNPDVLQLIEATAMNILDIGCGAGDNARILKQLNKYVAGVTISGDEAALLQNICDKIIVADIETDKLEFDRQFDVIILSHVCEHLRNPAEAVMNLSRYLSADGTVLIAVPNMAYYKNRFRILRGNWNMEETGPFDRTHLHFYSYNSADSLVAGDTFRIVKKVAGQLALPLWPLRRIFPGLAKRLDKSLGKYFPNLFSQQVILVLKNK